MTYIEIRIVISS